MARYANISISVVLLFIALLCSSYRCAAQGCDECSKPRLALYDSEIQVPRPTQADSIIAWYNLFWPSAAARAYLHTNDPTKDCLRWLDGALINAADLQGGVLKFGQEYANIAPAGPFIASDYLLRSTVTQSGGAYSFTLILESGPSREVVKSVTLGFASTVASANATGQAAAQQMMPLLQTIRAFEVKKRNTDVTVAIRDLWQQGTPQDITIEPAKTRVDTGETIDVKITMIDCDGVPLKNRQILFHGGTMTDNSGSPIALNPTTGGEITPATATTDDAGKVTVKFKAGHSPGTGNIIGWYPHKKPCGRVSAFEGTAMVQIKPSPAEYWLLTAEMMNTYTMNSDTSKNYDLAGHAWIEEHSSIVTMESKGSVTAVIRNNAEDPVNDFSYFTDTDEPVSLIVSGGGFMDEFSKYRETIDGQLMSADIRSDNVSGTPRPGASIQVDYSKDYKYIGVGIGIKGIGSYHGKMYGPHGSLNEWWEYGGDYADYGISAGGGGNPDDTTAVCWIDKTKEGYSALWSIFEKKQRSTYDGNEYTSRKAYLKATVVPYNLATAVKTEQYTRLFPGAFSLGQNFPNPFNPSTNITFQVQSRERVRLKIYDVLGKETATLVDEVSPRGTYTVTWNASGLPSGVYIYTLQAGSFIDSKKMIFVK